MHGVGVTKEVVHVAKNFLICSHEEDTYIVRSLLRVELMERKEAADGLMGDILRDFAVRVAGDVLKGCIVRRLLMKPVDRHDREELVDGPGIRERMEDGEIAEILIGHESVECSEFLRCVLE